jgi:exopolysaccharide production protein ExoZ
VASIKPNWFNTTSATFTNLVKSLLFIPYVNHNGMVRPILDVAWALFPEVWFYIVFYIAMKVTYKYRALLSTSFLIVVYLCGSVFAKNNKIFGQFKLSLLYLSSGILIYSLWKHWDDKLIKGVVSKSLSVALLILFFGVSLAFNFFTRKNLSVVAFLLVVVVFATFLFTEECVESIKALIWVGSISYSLYLTHEFVVKGINRILFSTDKINLLSLMVSVISFIIALICSRFICLVFEKKIPNKLYKLIYNR